MKLLDKITSPADFKNFTYSDLNRLCSEIRSVIIETVSKNGGHLASNLGVVELTIALHKVFDLSQDRFIFDVGHQCYTHKILTGRLGQFNKLRQYEGISGFPKPGESCYDAFGTGHSSTSISAALGYAFGRDITRQNYYVGAIIGDASLSSGMAFEALNHAGDSRRKMIIVLNDNEMSIAENVGALSTYLEKVRVGPVYNKLKEDIESFLKYIPVFGTNVAKFIERLKDSLKYLVVPGVIFEELGIKYIGPVDGHNIEQLVNTFENIKDFPGPVLVHTITKKGRGFAPAENAPEKYHSAGYFCLETGNSIKPKTLTYTDVFGTTLTQLAEKNNKIIAITAAMCEGTGLNYFCDKFKDRFFDVGICEQHALTFAAGIAMTGLTPVVALYSTFAQRALDQWIHDIALQNLHVVLCLDRAGLVGEDGPTHHGAFDLSMLKYIPNIVILAPSNEVELKQALFNAVNNYNCPVIVRYPKSAIEGTIEIGQLNDINFKYEPIEPGRSKKINAGGSVAVVCAGRTVNDAALAVKKLKDEHNIEVTLYDARFIKPLCKDMLKDLGENYKTILTIEDNAIAGGFGESVMAALHNCGYKNMNIHFMGLPDRFIEHGNNVKLREVLELDANGIVSKILEIYNNK